MKILQMPNGDIHAVPLGAVGQGVTEEKKKAIPMAWEVLVCVAGDCLERLKKEYPDLLPLARLLPNYRFSRVKRIIETAFEVDVERSLLLAHLIAEREAETGNNGSFYVSLQPGTVSKNHKSRVNIFPPTIFEPCNFEFRTLVPTIYRFIDYLREFEAIAGEVAS